MDNYQNPKPGKTYRRVGTMHHGMTIWTKRLHVVDRVNILGGVQCMQRDFMMYMDT